MSMIYAGSKGLRKFNLRRSGSEDGLPQRSQRTLSRDRRTGRQGSQLSFLSPCLPFSLSPCLDSTMNRFRCLLIALLLAAEARAESDAGRVVAGLRERGEVRRAEEYAAEQWRRDDLSESARAELAIQLALTYTEQALAAPPELRDALWAKAESSC